MEAEPTDKHKNDVLGAFNGTLNRHGYTFQQAVIEELVKLIKTGSRWHFQAAEFAVEVRGHGTKIDIVLQADNAGSSDERNTCYMLAECKRANPALANWCFVRAPYTVRGSYPDVAQIIFDAVGFENGMVKAGHSTEFVSGPKFMPYHIAAEVRTGDTGDSKGSSGRLVIEEALTQVLRGVNGTMEFLATNKAQFGEHIKNITLMPVIFTTAHLWVSDADLKTADLLTGNIDLRTSGFEQRDWLLYQYNMSPGLKQTQLLIPTGERPRRLDEVLTAEYIRTVPIVSAAGIGKFITWANERLPR